MNRQVFSQHRRKGESFDQHFEDLTNSQLSKKPKLFQNASKKVKTPLKFQFRTGPENATSGATGGTSTNRFVFKPSLSNTTKPAVVPKAADDDLWGDDDDDALLLAASQVVEQAAQKKEAVPGEDIDLDALTILLANDDDFDMDNDTGQQEPVANSRLNATIAVFNDNSSSSSRQMAGELGQPLASSTCLFDDTFKQPQSQSAEADRRELQNLKKEMAKLRQETARLKKERQQASGEVSLLRGEMAKKSKCMDEERKNWRNHESELQGKLDKSHKDRMAALSAIETEKIFFKQEIDVLQAKLKSKIEFSSPTPSKKMKVDESLKRVRSASPDERKDSPVKKSIQTQTNGRMARRFHKLDWRKTRTTSARLASDLPSVSVQMLRSKTKSGQEKALKEVAASCLSKLTCFIEGRSSSGSTDVSADDTTPLVVAVETLGQVVGLSGGSSELHKLKLQSVGLQLLKAAPHAQDLTVAVLNLLADVWKAKAPDYEEAKEGLSIIRSSLETLRNKEGGRMKLNEETASAVFQFVAALASRPDMFDLFCIKKKDGCFLQIVHGFIHACLTTDDPMTRVSAARFFVRWTADCLGKADRCPWLDNSCTWCTLDSVGRLMSVTHLFTVMYDQYIESTVREVDQDEKTSSRVDGPSKDPEECDGFISKSFSENHYKKVEKDDVKKELIRCIETLSLFQDSLRLNGDPDQTNWIRLVGDVSANQRRYMWTIQELQRLQSQGLKSQELANKLNCLTLVTTEES